MIVGGWESGVVVRKAVDSSRLCLLRPSRGRGRGRGTLPWTCVTNVVSRDVLYNLIDDIGTISGFSSEAAGSA